MWHRFLSWLAKRYLGRQVQKRPPAPLSQLNPAALERVLVLNATGLGDLLFSTPALRALKETYPWWQVDVLAHPRYASLLLENPHVARRWLYPGRGIRFFRLMGELGRQHYQLVIILHGNDPEATLLSWSTGCPTIIGSANSPLSFCYSAAVSHPDPHQHAVERRLDFARLLGADTPDKKMHLFLLPAEVQEAENILAQHFGTPPSLLIALHPTGSAPYKCWPLNYFAELGNQLSSTYRAAFLLVSGRRDRKRAASLASLLPGKTLLTGGRFSLRLTAALLSRCHLLVANDSGPLHLGLALRVPTLGLLGADHPHRIGPYQTEWGAYLYKKEEVCPEVRCLLRHCPDNRCLQAIAPSEVMHQIREWWEPRFLKGLK